MKKKANSANEKLIRDAYQIAEVANGAGFAAMFTEKGYFWDIGSSQKYFDENVVIVELRLQGTHDGPLNFGQGNIAPTGKKLDDPCCDIWFIENGKIKAFHCYNYMFRFFKEIGAL